ncbi:MAG TPA: uracil-DNA glycosylase family protein [Chthoniobacterales bacterium]|nr:uracil-DNA glycosylase family protein [Chthoniobacterales bacterium]
MNTSDALIAAALRLRQAASKLTFGPPVTHVYNPLEYAWRAHQLYLRCYGSGRKRVLFLGMNPGPFGMAQTGIPFGQIAAVRDWLRIKAAIDKPPNEHPKRRVTGFDCKRSEISGERLWGLFAKRFGTPEKFFAEHFVANCCPLAFIEASGRNRTPDKLPPNERQKLFAICDEHLRDVVRILEPEWLVGVGEFAAERARAIFERSQPRLGRILHPSPSCPESNVDWAGKVTAQLQTLGVWT